MRRRLIVAVTDDRGRPLPARASGGLSGWLPAAAPRAARGTVSIALLSDAAMARLNGRFRRKPRPTDVLSFPSEDAAARGRAPRHLGDLAIARGVAARQARARGHSLSVELRILALHGLLHLLGYDHEADHGQMAKFEARLARRAGLPVALSARPSPSPDRRR
jgi:probable rRNA maturation factor